MSHLWHDKNLDVDHEQVEELEGNAIIGIEQFRALGQKGTS